MNELAAEYTTKTAPCIPSGNAWFDAKSGGGYRMGKYTIVGARPKVGKSGWAGTSIATNCQQGRKVVDFSLEMDRGEVVRNLVPYVVDVPNIVVNRPWMQTPEQNRMVNEGLAAISEWPLSVYDGTLDIDQVCWTMDRETRHGESVLFVLDHFGLLGGAGPANKIRERYVENSTRLRKKIAAKKNCAMVVLFQLNPVPREVADKRPLPEDLKESKNPLEDCFACVLLHRYVDKDTFKMTKKANVSLALIRGGGAPGNVDCEFNSKRLSFEADAEIEYGEDD
jgi:replicative DNA helicase